MVLLKTSQQNKQCVDTVLGRATEVSVHDSSYNCDLGTYCQNLRSNFDYKLELTVMNLDLTQPSLDLVTLKKERSSVI